MDLNSDFDLFDYPAAPGSRGTDTSVAAAEAIAPHAVTLRFLALEAIAGAGEAGLTAEELADALAIERVAIQPRTSELRLLRKIADSGLRRPNRSGKRAIVWTLPCFVREAIQ